MTLDKIFLLFQTYPWLIAVLCLIGSLIEIPKIKISFLGLIVKKINEPVMNKLNAILEESRKGDAELSKEFTQSFKALNDKLDSHIKESAEARARKSRERIVAFNEELEKGLMPSGDRWADIVLEIDSYTRYCQDNPDFPNGVCVTSIHNIQEINKQRIKNMCEEHRN